MSIRICLALSLGLLCSATPQADTLGFEYTLDNRYQTSAGVYDADGRLVRTLWGNRTRDEGTHQASWDGLDDDGIAAPTGAEYEIKVLAHNVDYRWDGVIGNTSENQTSPGQLDYPYFMQDFEVSGRRAYTLSSTEGKLMRVRWHDLDHPNAGSQPNPGIENMRSTYLTHVATDGERVFVARLPSTAEDVAPDEHSAFVLALDADLSRELSFPGFGPLCTSGRTPYTSINNCYSDGQSSALYASGIDITAAHQLGNATLNVVTGMAVQRSGNYLFVAHGRLGDAAAVDPRTGGNAVDELHVIDKLSGQLMQVHTIKDIGELAVCRNASEPSATTVLWALHSNENNERVLGRFAVNAATGEVAALPDLTITGFSKPLNVSVSPDCNVVVVPDGGGAQQFKAFDANTGVPLWTLGESGGYVAQGPTVTTSKFSFTQLLDTADPSRNVELGFLGFEDDGSFWASDTGLTRVLRFDSSRSYVDQMAWMPINYSCKVDQNNASRVFREFKEYSVDYSKPIAESWTLLQDYSHSLTTTPARQTVVGFGGGFSSIATLENGRTYGIVNNARSSANLDVVEIIPGQPLRFTASSLTGVIHMTADGRLRSLRYASGGGDIIEICEQTLDHFDENNDPVWNPLTVVARVPRNSTDPRIALYLGVLTRGLGEFSDGTQLVFDPWKDSVERFRLAAVNRGDNRWLWRASKSSGVFDIEQPDGRYDNDQSPQYTAIAVDTLGEQAVYNYHGEFWRGYQAHQFLHFHRSGLFVGQFGTPNLPEFQGPLPGKGGNALSIQLAEARSKTWFWHSNEHTHAGLNRWNLDGVEWIRFWRGRGVLGSSQPIQLAMDALPDRSQFPAPVALTSIEIGNRGLLSYEGSHRLLTWQKPAGPVTGFELQKLVPTQIGRRFATIAMLDAAALSFMDTVPSLAQQDLYRLRAHYGQRASEWSQPHRTQPLAEPAQIFLENFNDPKWNRFEWYYSILRCSLNGSGPDGAYCGRQLDGSDHVLRRRIVAPGNGSIADNFTLFLRWPDESSFSVQMTRLAAEFNDALGRPVAAPPVYYKFSFGLKQVAAAVPLDAGTTATADISVELAPNLHPFLRTGGQVSVPLAALTEGTDSRGFRRIETVVAAIPNGRNGMGLGGFHFSDNAEAIRTVGINFTVNASGLEAGSSLEFWLDDVRIERLYGGTSAELYFDSEDYRPQRLYGFEEYFPYRAGDELPAAIADPALAALIRRMAGLDPADTITRFHLRLLAYLDLRGLGVTSLEGLQAASELRAIDLTGSAVTDLSPLDGLTNLGLRLGVSGSTTTPTQVPALPIAGLAMAALALLGSARQRLRRRARHRTN
jgi:hypothetical protein